MGVKRADKRKLDELRMESGVKEIKNKLVRSKLKWAGLVERIAFEKLAKRAETGG